MATSISIVEDTTRDVGFTDSVGGFHVDAIGYSPNGNFCGECCSDSCEHCGVWKNEEDFPTEVSDFLMSRFMRVN